MTSIVNFEENLKERKSDALLKSFNRFDRAKVSGILSEDELYKIIVLTSDLYANKISKGEVDKADIDETEELISGFIEPNYEGYFNFPHKDLDKAAKMFIEGDFFALEKRNQRNEQSSPLSDERTYEGGFKRL